MEAVEYDEDDEWRLVDTQFDLDFIDATVPGRIAAGLLCSEIGNSLVSYQQKLDGVDATLLRATFGNNVALCMSHLDAVELQNFCWQNGGRLLPPCTNEGGPVRFFGPTRKSIPDGVLRTFLESRENLFVRVVGYGMNMRLDMRGLMTLKRLRGGVSECKKWGLPTNWTTTMVSDFKSAMYKSMRIDFSWVTPINGVGKEGKEARLVRMKKKEGVAGYNQYQANVYPVSGGDGRKTGTVTLRKVRSR